jgi:aspartate ammonia-lyase
VRSLKANEERCWQNLMASSALATALVPELGYARVADIVRAALNEHRSFLEVAVERGLLRQEEVRSAMRRAAIGPPGASE